MSSPVACGGGGAMGVTVAAALQFFAASQCLLREGWPANAAVDNGSSWDFIVVGGGTAGAALAARLSRLPATVLLLEAGGDPPQESIVPGLRDVLKGSEYDWKFRSVAEASAGQALRGGRQRQPRGRMLGGSGSLNDMVYARGFPPDYRDWAAVAGDTWNWTNVLTHFKKTEHITDERIINDPELMKYHARNGEIEVAGLNESTQPTDRFLEAFKELGFPIVKDMTNPNLFGAGRFSHTIKDGRRDSTLTAMLNKEEGKDNLKVVKNALVTKVLIENNTAYGVEALIDEEKHTLFAKKEVIVSAGTFNTAKLLLLSGLGPKEHLKDLGIDVVKDLPVGENLHDHVMVLTFLAADNGTCYVDESTSHLEVIKYLYDGSGSLSKTNSMGAYITGAENVPEFAIYPTCMPMGTYFYDTCLKVLGFKEDICTRLQSELADHEVFPLAVVLLKPKSRGRVRLQSTDPADAPLIYSGTFSDASDLEGYPKALEVAWSVANTSYFRAKNARVVDFGLKVCDGLEKVEAIRCGAKAMATSAWHAVGTAAMGTVVDGALAVRGVRGLRVVDASVMPKVIRGNTNAPVVMIAEMAAEFIEEQYLLQEQQLLT